MEYRVTDWRPVGYTLELNDGMVSLKFIAKHPHARGKLRIYPPDPDGFRKMEFLGRLDCQSKD